jgi:chorismate mutase
MDRVPLLCTREVPVPGSLPRVIRLLLHYYAAEDHQPRHVYLGAARVLRSDLEAAQ